MPSMPDSTVSGQESDLRSLLGLPHDTPTTLPTTPPSSLGFKDPGEGPHGCPLSSPDQLGPGVPCSMQDREELAAGVAGSMSAMCGGVGSVGSGSAALLPQASWAQIQFSIRESASDY